MTGADSPVIADSSTVAMPSTTSPSPGMTSPAATTHRSPTASCDDDFSTIVPSAVRHAGDRVGSGLAQRRGLRLAAPFGHRLGEVGEQHGEPQPQRDQTGEHVLAGACDEPRSRMNRIVVSTEPTSTMNITGLRIIVRGLSLRERRRSPARRSPGRRSTSGAGGLVRDLRRTRSAIGARWCV